MNFRPYVRVTTIAMWFVISTPVWAHPHLKTEIPAADAVVAAPSEISIVFDDAIEPAFSSLSVSDSLGHPVTVAKAELDAATHKQMRLSMPTLAPGVYEVKWIAVGCRRASREWPLSFYRQVVEAYVAWLQGLSAALLDVALSITVGAAVLAGSRSRLTLRSATRWGVATLGGALVFNWLAGAVAMTDAVGAALPAAFVQVLTQSHFGAMIEVAGVAWLLLAIATFFPVARQGRTLRPRLFAFGFAVVCICARGDRTCNG